MAWMYWVGVILWAIDLVIFVAIARSYKESKDIVKEIKKRKDENDRKSIQRDNR